MARKHAQVLTSIWADPNFAALTPGQQRAYLFLLSQPDLSLAGVLVARPRVWARRAEGLTLARLQDELLALDVAGFIVWDQDTDEVWLRSFHKHNIAGSPKAMIGASRALGAVVSPVIRERILAVVHPDLRESFAAEMAGVPFSDLRERMANLPAWDTPSHTPCDTPSEGVSTTETGYQRPETGDRRPDKETPPSPEPSLALVPMGDPQPPAAASSYPADFTEWWEHYPRKTGKGAAAKAYRKARKTLTPGSLLVALDAHVDAWQANGKDPQFIPHPATWLNEARYDDPPEPITAPTRRNNRVDDNLAAIQAGLARAKEMGL